MRFRAARLGDAGESATLAVSRVATELRRQGVDVIDLSVGEPDFDTPRPIIDATIAALEEGFTRYTPAIGIPELREAVAERYADRYGGPWGAGSVAITVGAKQALFNAFMATLSAGEEVLIPTPAWVSFAPQVRLASARPRFVPTSWERGFVLDPADLEAAIGPDTRMIILNSPCNPTGAVLPRETLRAIADIAVARDLLIVSDETYDQLVFDPDGYASMAELHETLGGRLVLVGSFSKTYAMTGLRVGYVLAEPDLVKGMAMLQGHTTSNPTSVAQRGALAALRHPGDLVSEMVVEYRARRDMVVEALGKIDGVELNVPDATFYAFPRVAHAIERLGLSGSVELAKRMLEDHHVAVVPGLAFEAEGFIRVSFAASRKQLADGLDRIRLCLES